MNKLKCSTVGVVRGGRNAPRTRQDHKSKKMVQMGKGSTIGYLFLASSKGLTINRSIYEACDA